MTEPDLLNKIYEMQTVSNERDARLETRMEYLSSRMDRTESLLEKMSEVLNSQKHLSSVVDTLALQVGAVKETQEKIENRLKDHASRIANMEAAPAQHVYDGFKKIIWILVPIIVTSGFYWLIDNIKNPKK